MLVLLKYMKTFFTTIGRSIYSPQFYDELREKPFSFSFKYYVKLSLFVSFVVVIAFAISYIPKIKNGINAFSREPYVIPMPESLQNAEGQSGNTYKNLLVIDTRNSFDLAKFHAADTMLTLTRDSIAGYRNSNRANVQVIALASVPDITIDQAMIRGIISRIQPVLNVLVYLSLPFVFLAGLLYAAWRMLYLLIASLIIWLALKIMKKPSTYGKAYQVGLHAITLPILAETCLFVFPVAAPFWGWFSVALLIMVVVNSLHRHAPVATVA